MYEELVFTWRSEIRLGSRRVGITGWGVRFYDRLIARWPNRCKVVRREAVRSYSINDLVAIARVN